jgi:hypothetical protein
MASKINYIERFNNTLRQRVSRLVREALSFSKKLAKYATTTWRELWRRAKHYMDMTTSQTA